MTMSIEKNLNTYVSQLIKMSKAVEIGGTTSTQTLDEFKSEIKNIISGMVIHPSQARTNISISISDNAFKKMMDSPSYKDEMLRVIQRDLFGAYPAAAAPSYMIINIGNDCEYSAASMGSAYGDMFSAASARSFWKRLVKDNVASDSYYLEQTAMYQSLAMRQIDENRTQDMLMDEKAYEKGIIERNNEYTLRLKQALSLYDDNIIHDDM